MKEVRGGELWAFHRYPESLFAFEKSGPMELLKGYQADDAKRAALNRLVGDTFGGLSFEEWHQRGFWNAAQCIPYTFFDGDRAVSHILVSVFDFHLRGRRRRYIQLGTVMTAPAYRMQGLSRLLMDTVLTDWETQCDSIYLYANDSVTNFYPKFGFTVAHEHRWSCTPCKRSASLRKLSLSDADDRRLLIDKCRAGNPFAAVHAENCMETVLFHCMTFFSDALYFLSDCDAVVIAASNMLLDIFGGHGYALTDILSACTVDDGLSLTLGFMPHTDAGFQIEEARETGTTLFLLAHMDNPFRNDRLTFPLLTRT